MARRRRNSRTRKEAGVIGQASWASSVINLVNTSTSFLEQQSVVIS